MDTAALRSGPVCRFGHLDELRGSAGARLKDRLRNGLVLVQNYLLVELQAAMADGFGNGSGKPDLNQARVVCAGSEADQFAAALDAFRRGELFAAQQLCASLLQSSVGHALGLGLLAMVEKQLGNRSAAAHFFSESLKANPQNADIHHNFAGLLIRSDLHQALHHASAAVELVPTCSAFHERLACIQWRLGHFDATFASAQKALELNPDSGQALLTLGAVLKEQCQWDQAVVACRKAINCEPSSASAYALLAIILKEQGNLEDAWSAASRALQLDPRSAEALYAAGLALQAIGD